MKVLTSKDLGSKYYVINQTDDGFKVSKKWVLTKVEPIVTGESDIIDYNYTFSRIHDDTQATHRELSMDGIALVPEYLFDKNNVNSTLEEGRYYVKIKRKSSRMDKGIYQCISKGVNDRGYEYGYMVNVLKRNNVRCEDFININSNLSLWCSNVFLLKETFDNYLKRLKEGKSE